MDWHGKPWNLAIRYRYSRDAGLANGGDLFSGHAGFAQGDSGREEKSRRFKMNTLAFEDGHPVPIEQFDYEQFDVPVFDLRENEVKAEAKKLLRQILSHFVQNVMDAPKPKLWLECFAFAAQMTDISEVDIARKHGVTKAAISKTVVQIAERYDLPPARGMRSVESRKTFSETQKCLHQRKRELQSA